MKNTIAILFLLNSVHFVSSHFNAYEQAKIVRAVHAILDKYSGDSNKKQLPREIMEACKHADAKDLLFIFCKDKANKTLHVSLDVTYRLQKDGGQQHVQSFDDLTFTQKEVADLRLSNFSKKMSKKMN